MEKSKVNKNWIDVIKRDGAATMENIHALAEASKKGTGSCIPDEYFTMGKLVKTDFGGDWGLVTAINKKKKKVFVRTSINNRLERRWIPYFNVSEISVQAYSFNV